MEQKRFERVLSLESVLIPLIRSFVIVFILIQNDFYYM